MIDVRARLGLPPQADDAETMGVTVEYQSELYTLLVDAVGDVISIDTDRYEENPSTLDQLWREFADGVYRLDERLMVVLDVAHLLEIRTRAV